MRSEHWVQTESISNVVSFPLYSCHCEKVVTKFFPNSDKSLVVQHVEGLAEDADQWSVIRADLEGWQATEIELRLGDGILDC